MLQTSPPPTRHGDSASEMLQTAQLPGISDSKGENAGAVLQETLENVRAVAAQWGVRLQDPQETEVQLEAQEEEEQQQQGFVQKATDLEPRLCEAVAVFASLCRLSSADTVATPQHRQQVQPAQPVAAARLRRLSLELLHGMLQTCGRFFVSSEPFIADLKSELCVSLVGNAMSLHPEVHDASLRLVSLLIKQFREQLKVEVGVFVEQVVLRMLESWNSAFRHKQQALQVLHELCADAQAALELFLNFDCDVDERNIFEHMVSCLSKIAQGKYTAAEYTGLIQPHQEQELRALALRALVSLMGSTLAWAQRRVEDCVDEEETSGRRVVSKDDADGSPESTSRSPAVLSRSPGADAAPPSTEVQRQRKHMFHVGVSKFNMRPKHGLEYLRQKDFVGGDCRAVAEFLKTPDIGINKTTVGDFLGEDKPFSKSVLRALADSLDFAGGDFNASLRQFVSIFRLPGEAQKISRMMETFAEKYCRDNPQQFADADTAFLLSFSMILLQTDLHNPGVKNKMTKEQYVTTKHGIDGGKDLSRDFLASLYDSVASTPLSLLEDDIERVRQESQAAQGAAKRGELFERERDNVVLNSVEVMKRKNSQPNSRNYVLAGDIRHARHLCEVASWPALATFSVCLEMQNQRASIELCIEGFRHCITAASLFDMHTQRDAFVSSLANFTYLASLKEMKPKNVECIKALFAIGLANGSKLGSSWHDILQCISQLDRLQLINIGVRQDFELFASDGSSSLPLTSGSGASSKVAAGNQTHRRSTYGTGVSALISFGTEDQQVDVVNAESVMAEIDATQIDVLFDRSSVLEASALVHFVTQLARVSKEELASADQPRIFALQKLVEVVDGNMNRIPAVWSRFWHVVSQHFVEVVRHPNIHVCMFALDSLRQLVMKFLANGTLSSCRLQPEILQPFEVMMANAPGVSCKVKERIVSVISSVVQAPTHDIGSGWKTVFHILRMASREQGNEFVPQCAFAVIGDVIEHEYSVFAENFGDGVQTLLAFGQCTVSSSMSQQAIVYLLRGAKYLAGVADTEFQPSPSDGKAVLVPPPPSTADASGFQAAHWLAILESLSTIVNDPRHDVQVAALNGIFACLRDYGSTVFDSDMWQMVFRGVIKPLFDEMLHHHGARGYTHPERTVTSRAVSAAPLMCLPALTASVELFAANLEALLFLLDDVLSLIDTCIRHETEAAARAGIACFKHLLVLTGSRLNAKAWQRVSAAILHLFNDSMPVDLLDMTSGSLSDAQLRIRSDQAMRQCSEQLLLIGLLQATLQERYQHVHIAGVANLLDALQRSFEFAARFNRQIGLRRTLDSLGLTRVVVGMLRQEREALGCYLKVLFQVLGDAHLQGSEHTAHAKQRLMCACGTVLRDYIRQEQMLQEQERAVPGLVPTISTVLLGGLNSMQGEQLARCAPELFPLLAELFTVSCLEVRLAARDVLLGRVAPLLCAVPCR